MTSLWVVTAFGRRLGGSDNILWSFLRNVDRERFDVTVVFLEGGAFSDEVSSLGLRTLVLPGGRLRDPVHIAATGARLARLLGGARPNVVLNWLSTSQVPGGLGALVAGLSERTIWWQLDMHMRGALTRDRLLDQVATVIPARAIGACSEATAAHQRRLRPRRETIAVLPGIAEPSETTRADLMELRETLDIPPKVTVVGTVGRLFAWKGHHRMIEMIAILRDRELPCHALIVGGGGHRADMEYEAAMHETVERLGLEDSVTFTGQVADATPYFGLMDVFVNCSTPEPFGLVVLEAMATGTATVAVDLGGPAEIIESGRSGALARSGRPTDLADAVAPLVEDAGERERLAQGGRRRFEARFREEATTQEMMDLFERLAA